jgi:hypothetical protein
MATYECLVQDGPAKAALLRAAHEHLHLRFQTDEGHLEVHVDAVKDVGHGIPDVTIRGHITCGRYQGRAFIGTYNPTAYKGSLHLENAP